MTCSHTITITFEAHNVPEDVTPDHIREYLRAFLENTEPDLCTKSLDAMAEIECEVVSIPMPLVPLMLILAERPRAERLHPVFATTLDAAMTALTGEAGEVANAIQRESLERIITEVAQVGCVSVRFLEMLLAMLESKEKLEEFAATRPPCTCGWCMGCIEQREKEQQA